MGKTWLLSQIKQIVNPEKESLILDGDYVYIMDPETNRLLKLFVRSRHRYVQVDLLATVQFIANKLKDKVDIQKFLEELMLLHSSPEEILELHDRLQRGEVSVKGKPRCYALMIGGKPGSPYEFVLVSPQR